MSAEAPPAENARQESPAMGAEPSGPKEDIGIGGRCFLWTMGFFAYWTFGFGMLDKDGDGDFDEDDIRHMLDDIRVMFGGKRKMSEASRNRTFKTRSVRAGNKPKSPSAAEKAKQAVKNKVDKDGDGHVSAFEMASAAMEDDLAEGEEASDDHVRHLPFFSFGQIVVPLLFWIVFSMQDEGIEPYNVGRGWAETRAGLDSLEHGLFDLRNFDLETCDRLTFEVWRWITYQWTHISIKHILFNSIFVLLLAVPLEMIQGCIRMALIFNAGVIAGALNTFVFDIHKSVVGMSGGCYGLVGCHLADLILNWGHKRFKKPSIALLIILVAVEWIPSYLADPQSERTSQTAHTGGFLGGLAAGIVFGYNAKVRRAEYVLMAVCFILYFGFSIFAVIWGATADKNFYSVGAADPWNGPEYCGLRLLWNEPPRGQGPSQSDWTCVLVKSKEEMDDLTNNYLMNHRGTGRPHPGWQQTALSIPTSLVTCEDYGTKT
mmetsp:Transcript_74344/g.138840  ORF Transcript_74344/g.138840 Transcript_74344/m.138840 type:complete len:488 (-) Transcript_74344:166-1629(-)